jgi:hypothetical protein
MFDWFEWEEDKWIVYLGLIIFVIILLDEAAYLRWKIQNPGTLWSRVRDEMAPLVDPSAPPTTIY